MVIAYHVVFSTYGFWLPNDPRGSNSDFVRAEHLLKFGNARRVPHRRSVARAPHNSALRAAAKRALTHEPVEFSGLQARAVARGFAEFVGKSGVALYACAILPKHVHLVVARHRYKVEQVVNFLKGSATRRLIDEGIYPHMIGDVTEAKPPVWGRDCRKVFLDTAIEVREKIDYVRDNPTKEGKPPQHWAFVTDFD